MWKWKEKVHMKMGADRGRLLLQGCVPCRAKVGRRTCVCVVGKH